MAKKSAENIIKLMQELPNDSIAELITNSPEWRDAVQPFMQKEIELDNGKYPDDPLKFIQNILEYNLWQKQIDIAKSVQENRNTVVSSGHSVGKSLLSATLAAWWLATHDPAVVITLAPCYDDKTEVLTDRGWMFFANLDGSEKIACLSKDGQIKYEYPEDRFVFPYSGELVGYKSQLIDFLVTPNHRLLFDTFITRNEKQGTFKGKIISAENAYGKNGRFKKYAKWTGKDTNISLDWAEFLGFWFAEGWAEYNPEKRKYRIVLTNSDQEYTENLLKRVELSYKCYRKTQKPHIIDYTVYNKQMAFEFVKYGKTFTKRVPENIKNATPEIINAFLYGFWQGDGSTDKNNSTCLLTSNYALAGDLQELCLKIGTIANVETRKFYPGSYETDKPQYAVKYWNKRGKYPQAHRYQNQRNHTNKYPGWYKTEYSGYVYSVKVSDYNPGDGEGGIILVRRNGKYIWSGNTHVQVNNILWRYMRSMVRSKNLPGEIFDTPRWNIHSLRFALGISPKKNDESDVAAAQGYHSKFLLVIMDEAAGMPRIMFDAVMNLATSTENRVLAIGNPIEQSGPFWDACNSSTWNHIQISCLEHPNVINRKETISGAVSYEWVVNMIKDHCVRTEPNTPSAFEFDNQYYLPDPVFEARVLGRAPSQAEDQLIPGGWIFSAKNLEIIPSGEKIIGFDPSQHGGDDATMVCRQGGKILWIKRRRPLSKDASGELAGWLISELIDNEVTHAYVDSIGAGIGVVDACTRAGFPVYGVNVSRPATQRKRFVNLRTELYWRIRDALKENLLALPDDDLLDADLITPKYTYDHLGRMELEEKKQIIQRINRSPDTGDALSLTFMLNLIDSSDENDVLANTLISQGRWTIPELPGISLGKKSSGSRWKSSPIKHRSRPR